MVYWHSYCWRPISHKFHSKIVPGLQRIFSGNFQSPTSGQRRLTSVARRPIPQPLFFPNFGWNYSFVREIEDTFRGKSKHPDLGSRKTNRGEFLFQLLEILSLPRLSQSRKKRASFFAGNVKRPPEDRKNIIRDVIGLHVE